MRAQEPILPTIDVIWIEASLLATLENPRDFVGSVHGIVCATVEQFSALPKEFKKFDKEHLIPNIKRLVDAMFPAQLASLMSVEIDRDEDHSKMNIGYDYSKVVDSSTLRLQ